MSYSGRESIYSRLLTDYGMLLVLIVLCVLFSILTLREQTVTGQAGAEQIVRQIQDSSSVEGARLAITGDTEEELEFARALERLAGQNSWSIRIISGAPPVIRATLAAIDSSGDAPDQIVTTSSSRPVVTSIVSQLPGFRAARIVSPSTRRWPTFLLVENLRNVANQITVIAIIAIGMTMVIITAGIDLSVGSLIALSAVVVAWAVEALGGAGVSSTGVMLACLAALAACTVVGAFSGLMITVFRIPPFIATLAMMQLAAGVAYIISQGKPIYQLPEGFVWLGRGTDPVVHIPIAVILMFLLYVIAWVMMERTVLGRHIYAVGGNPEAARLAGIRVNTVLLFVYTLCGLLAGLGGIVMASQLKSGAPTYGLTYELYVIAAVVVGGTSLSGGEGKIVSTLIGAFIIGVIQNGMNLINIETYTQKVVLGLVILAAVLFDRLKQKGLKRSIGLFRSLPKEKKKVTST